MKEQGIDGILLSSPINQSYITGADFNDGYVAVTADRCVACVDFRYIEAVKNSVSEGVEAELAKGSALNCAIDVMLSCGGNSDACGVGRICYGRLLLSVYLVGENACSVLGRGDRVL